MAHVYMLERKGWQRRVQMLVPKIVCVPQAILRHYLVAWPQSIVVLCNPDFNPDSTFFFYFHFFFPSLLVCLSLSQVETLCKL